MEDAVLDPAHEQFGFGPRAGKTAHIVTDIVEPAKAHAESHGDIVAQRLPGCVIVARPGLRVTLQARRAGPANKIGALVRPVFKLGLERSARHQK